MTAEQREKARAANRRWYQRNLESQRLRSRIKAAKAFKDNPDKIRQRNAQWRADNIEKFRAKDRRYHVLNRERRNLAAKLYHESKKNDPHFKAAHSLRGKRNYQQKKQAIQARHQQWMQAHPGIQRVYSQRRRALEKAAAINMAQIKEWMLSIKAKPLALCYYCGARVNTDHIHFEHIIPLSRGGAHSIENLCVSCVVCNLTKGTATLDEWQKPGQQVLSI